MEQYVINRIKFAVVFILLAGSVVVVLSQKKAHEGNFPFERAAALSVNRFRIQTRRGTGYYKVPSLKGVWYRGPFEHNGSVATLEDWFDPRRLQDDYVPTGFKGAGVMARPVKGHRFGLGLLPSDRQALISFSRRCESSY